MRSPSITPLTTSHRVTALPCVACGLLTIALQIDQPDAIAEAELGRARPLPCRFCPLRASHKTWGFGSVLSYEGEDNRMIVIAFDDGNERRLAIKAVQEAGLLVAIPAEAS
ncbi:MAG TPA: hypothetical protein VI072_32105 [Polyangiaceae bacterium]